MVDVKTPLDAYLSAIEASDDASRVKFLEKHAQNVRSRVRELAAKSYWSQFQESPDFVVLFIPGDQFLSAALDLDRTLLEDALTQKGVEKVLKDLSQEHKFDFIVCEAAPGCVGSAGGCRSLKQR